MVDNLDLLIIDDDPVMEMHFKQILKGIDINYEFYACPEEGFDRLKQNGAVIFIVDLMMPKLTGEEIAIKFSEEMLFEKGDIYLYTAKEFNDDERFKMLTLGFLKILKKPMKKETFISILDEHGLLNKKAAA